MSRQLFESIIQDLESCESTTTIVDIENLDISDKDIGRLCDCLLNNKKVHTLRLANCSITDEGAKNIAKALKSMSIVREVDLSWNKISKEGAKELASVLEENCSVRTLNLYSNQVGEEGAGAISRMLKVNVGLYSINLGENNLGDQGAITLAESIKENVTLGVLNLFWNKMTNKGVAALVEAININDSLRSLDVRSNEFDEVGERALIDMLENNFGLESLEYKDCGIADIKVNPQKNSKECSLYKRNEKVRIYLPLLILLRNMALSKQLPSDEECKKIKEEFLKIVKKNNKLVEASAKECCESGSEVASFLEKIVYPKSVKDLRYLVRVICDCLQEHLGDIEFTRLNKKSFSPISTDNFLIAWEAECEPDIRNFDVEVSILMNIPLDHPLRGYAHVRAAVLLGRTLNEITRGEEDSLLNKTQEAAIYSFLHHCARARSFGLDDQLPKQLEENVLKYLGSFIIGKGWMDLQVTESDLINQEIFCGKGLIEWLRKCFERLANEKSLKVIRPRSLSLSDLSNSKEPDPSVDVVLLEDKMDNTLREGIIQKYPNALVAPTPFFLSPEERPFQRFLKSFLIGNYEFIRQFEEKIQEIANLYLNKKIDLTYAKSRASALFLNEIKNANQFKLLYIFNFVKNNSLCEFIHEQKYERWDRTRIKLFGSAVKSGKSRVETKSTQSNRWWNTATFTKIVKETKNKWLENEKSGDLMGLDRDALLNFDCGNVFHDKGVFDSHFIRNGRTSN